MTGTSNINQFLTRREERWRRLEALLARVETGGLGSLSPDEVREFGALHRGASSDLVVARAKTANAEVLEYLNDLIARSYAQVYRARRFKPVDLFTFLAVDFPRLVRATWRYHALAAGLFLAAAVAGWQMNRADPTGAYYILPPALVEAIPGMKSRWAESTGHRLTAVEMSLISTFIMAHNIGVGIWAFAGGIFFGIGPFWAMIDNGMMLGILGQAMSRPDTALVFWAMILPHGILELTAIFIMGGAGFLIGGALIAPGRRSRRDALVERGRHAVCLVLGAAAMLVVAGLIEGFITPPEFIPPTVKLLFAGGTFVALVLFFIQGGRGPRDGVLDTGSSGPGLSG